MSQQPTNQDILDALHTYNVSISEKFKSVDGRFDGMDKKFDQIDKKFDKIDEKFDKIDKKFDKVELKLNNVLHLAVQNQQVLKGLVTREEFDVFRDNTASRLDMMIANTITVEHELVFFGEQQDRNTSDIARIKEKLQVT